MQSRFPVPVKNNFTDNSECLHDQTAMLDLVTFDLQGTLRRLPEDIVWRLTMTKLVYIGLRSKCDSYTFKDILNGEPSGNMGMSTRLAYFVDDFEKPLKVYK